MIAGHTVSLRLYLSFHSRRFNRYCAIKLIARYRSPRHILCSSPLPLRSLNGSGFRNHRRIRPLIPLIHRLYAKRYLSKNSLHDHIRGSKHDVLPPTLPRPIRYTPTILRLPRCLHHMKHSIFHRFIHFINCGHANNLHNLRSIRIQTRSTNCRTHLNKY